MHEEKVLQAVQRDAGVERHDAVPAVARKVRSSTHVCASDVALLDWSRCGRGGAGDQRSNKDSEIHGCGCDALIAFG